VPFDGLGTTFTPYRDNTIPAIPEAVSGLVPGTLYHWRSRQRYDTVRNPWFRHGPWMPAPNNAWSEPDLRTAGNASASAVPDGDMVPGIPLTLNLDDSGPQRMLMLDWGESCGGEAMDYAVYVGTIGNFTTHVPCTCSTGGLTNFGYPPDDIMPQYYLVVPINKAGQREGSYGVDSSGASRSPSQFECFPAAEPAVCTP